jgi:hypothetical protein
MDKRRKMYLNSTAGKESEKKGKYRIKKKKSLSAEWKPIYPAEERKEISLFRGKDRSKHEVIYKYGTYALTKTYIDSHTSFAPDEAKRIEKETPKQTLIKESKAFM